MNESYSAPYEYAVKQEKTRTLLWRRVTLISAYVLFGAVCLLVGSALQLLIPFLAITPIAVFSAVFLTWRLTQAEYEYSFFAGTLTVARILGGRNRRVLCEMPLQSLERVMPCDAEECAGRINGYEADRSVFAGSSESAPALFAALGRDSDGRRTVLYFEPTERALRIIRQTNIAAVSREYTDRGRK